MTPADFLQLLRRRWIIPVGAALLAGVLAFVSAPSSESPTGPVVEPGTVFTATSTLLVSPETQQPPNLPLLRLLITAGDIPERAAEALGDGTAPAQLAAEVTVGGDDGIGSLTIASSGSDPERVDAVATAFTDATLSFLADRNEARRQDRIASLTTSLQQVGDAVTELDEDIAATGGSEAALLTAQKAAQTAEYQSLFQELLGLQRQPAGDVGLDVLQEPEAVATGVTNAPVVSAPTDKGTRGALGLALGLLLGLGAALLLERLDTRLRSRSATEHAFRLPVVAEIPRVARRELRGRRILTRSSPQSAVAEAYRGLRSSLALLPSRPVSPFDNDRGTLGVDRRGEQPHPDSPQVILVTSAGPRAGKTTTVGNLSVAFAETGKRVLVLDFDLRNPETHTYLDVDNGRGLTDLAGSGLVQDLAAVARPTVVPGVSVVTAGSEEWSPGLVTAWMATIVQRARESADIVIIDAPPLLGGSDALDVIPHVDTTLVVSAAGRTSPGQAERVSDLLQRISARVLGVVLVGVQSPAAYPSGSAGGWPWWTHGSGRHAGAERWGAGRPAAREDDTRAVESETR